VLIPVDILPAVHQLKDDVVACGVDRILFYKLQAAMWDREVCGDIEPLGTFALLDYVREAVFSRPGLCEQRQQEK